LILSAALLAMLDYADAVQAGTVIDPKQTKRRVLGIDIDIRAHNRAAIEEHPMAHRIDMIQGSSTAPDIIAEVKRHAGGFERIMVCLDSNHTHEHVLGELEGYAQLTTKGCYCVVLDTSIEDVPEGYFTDRPWGKGNNPRTAVHEYVKAHPEFEIDHRLDAKLQVTVAKEGYLRRIA
jgi:cephalosporin hydroxylase